MPELPDVEQYRRYWSEHAAGAVVTGIVVTDPAIVRNAAPRELHDALRGERLEEPERHGKWLLARTTGPTLLLHFGMTGDLEWRRSAEGRHPHDRVVVETDRGEMRYRNMRKLGGVWLGADERELALLLGDLGPDALAVPRGELLRRLRSRRGGVKAALMDQRLVAGVGNLVADEVLWQARLHPRTRVDDLAEDDLRQLASTLRRVLRESVERYDYIARKRSWLSHVRGRPGARCPRCGETLTRTTAAGRTTWYCPACQTATGRVPL